MIDVVYLYTAGADTTEIRYSLRSIVKHLSGFRNIYIVGDDPGIFKDVIHLPCENKHKHNKARNIYERILLACRQEEMTGHFLYMSDDIFLKRNFVAIDFPYYYCKTLPETLAGLSKESSYKKYIESTVQALQAKGLPLVNFNGHYPIVYHRQLFQDVTGEYNWEVPKGYVAKSLYCNTLKIKGDFLNDCKIHTPKTKTAIYRKINDSPVFSTDTMAVNDPMKEVLQELYPQKSGFEK